MVDQTLRTAEARRLGIRISDAQVEAAYQRFASTNKMQLSQLDGVMEQVRRHARRISRNSSAPRWPGTRRWRALPFARSGTAFSEQDAGQRMLEKGGAKPSATEYMLQQVIFVVPAGERGATLAKRKREADAMRARFNGCDTTREFAKGLVDVTVRDLGRVLAPQLPPDWADRSRQPRSAAPPPCAKPSAASSSSASAQSREVSDDKVAQMVFQSEGPAATRKPTSSARNMSTSCRKKARIVKR